MPMGKTSERKTNTRGSKEEGGEEGSVAGAIPAHGLLPLSPISGEEKREEEKEKRKGIWINGYSGRKESG